MKYNKFIELDKEIDGLFEQKKYNEALILLEDGLKTLPEQELKDNSFLVMWDKIVVYTSCEKYDEAFGIVRQTIEDGFSLPLHYPRFKFLQQKSGYDDLKARNDKLISELKKSAKAEYKVYVPDNYDPMKRYPLFMALHGDGMCNMQELSGYWKPDIFLANNVIFAYIQSSQVNCHNGYGWTYDLKTARMDIKYCYDSIASRYPIDESSILIGGFSGGAEASVDFTMSHIIPVKGFIALCPEIKTEAFTEENVKLAAERGVRGVFLEGELVLPMESEEEMLKVFDEVNLPYEYYINKGIGHRAPDDFDDKLNHAVKFILE